MNLAPQCLQYKLPSSTSFSHKEQKYFVVICAKIKGCSAEVTLLQVLGKKYSLVLLLGLFGQVIHDVVPLNVQLQIINYLTNTNFSAARVAAVYNQRACSNLSNGKRSSITNTLSHCEPCAL